MPRPARLAWVSASLCAALAWVGAAAGPVPPPSARADEPGATPGGSPEPGAAGPSASPAGSLSDGAEGSARAETLASLLRRAERAWPGLSAADHRVAAAEARLQEAWLSPLLQFNATAGAAMVPGARGTPVFSPDSQLPLGNTWGPALSVRVEGAIPLYTFGKLGAGRDAARAGIAAAEAERERARAQLRFDVRRAYFALGLALDARQMIREGQSKLDRAVRRLEERIAADDPDASEMDRWRLASTLAEIEGRASEAERLEAASRAALATLANLPGGFEVPDCPMRAVEVPARPAAWYRTAARLHRPELGLLAAGVAAREAGLDAARAQYFPDLALVLTAGYSWAPGITNQSNPFVQDAANTPVLGAGLAARWSLDFYGHSRRYARASEELLEVRDRLDEARAGVDIEVATVLEELRDARRREQAWGRGHRETRAWFVAAAQGYQVGAVDPRDLVDAVRAYFTARFSHMTAIHDVNVATARLERALGAEVVPPDAWEGRCE